MRVLTQLNRRERIALVVCLFFLAGTLLLSYVDQFRVYRYAKSLTDPEYQRLHYTGTIVVPESASGQCRFTQFDNKTIELKRTDIAECNSRPGVNSPYDRVNSLRDAFRR